MDDFDDLLEDIPQDTNKNKAKVVSKATTKKAAMGATNLDDDWGDLDFDDPKPSQPAKRAGTAIPKYSQKEGGSRLSPPGRYNKMVSSASGGFGFGGPDGLKKEPRKADEDDDDWGDLGGGSSGAGGGRLLGRKPKKDDDDDFDDLLEGMVGPSKEEQSKAEKAKAARPKTAAAAGLRSGGGAWGAGIVDDGLEDLDDVGS